jgi:DHA1 family inner membrane transport protein
VPTDAKASEFRWTGALILFGILFLGVSDTQLIPPLLASMAEELDTTAGRMSNIVTVYALAAAAAALLLGPLSDRIGRKQLISIALLGFAAASLITSRSSYFSTLVISRVLTGLSAGALSTLSLSYAGDLYPYQHRGKAMGILSMAYFLAFVIGIPVGAIVTSLYGWNWVFVGLAGAAGIVLPITIWKLPGDSRPRTGSGPTSAIMLHFRHPDRFAGIVAAFLTSGGLVGFITYVGVWLDGQGISVVRYSWLFMAAGVAATIASPLSGWLSDRTSKRSVILWANIALAPLFVVVSGIVWGPLLFIGIGLLSVTASARQGPLHALTTELVGPEIRGSYVAVRNAASQLGIAVVTSVSAVAFDASGFVTVAWIAALVTILIPLTLIWMREPVQKR